MPDSKLNQPPGPPPLPPRSAAERPLGEDPNDRAPIGGAIGVIETVLRHPRRISFQLAQAHATGRLIGLLLTVALGFVAVYGAIVGSFSGGDQWWAAPLKITCGLAVTAAICLPSLHIFACLSGSTARLGEVAGALCGALTLATLLLIGFAPVAWLFSQSTRSIAMMGFLHLAFWLVAAGFGVRYLKSAFQQYGLRSESGLNVWVVIFLLVSLQMTTALRPLVGPAVKGHFLPPPAEKKFFVAHWIDSLDDQADRTTSKGD